MTELDHTKIVTASLTTPAIVTVTALVTEMRMYSVKTCKRRIQERKGNNLRGLSQYLALG